MLDSLDALKGNPVMSIARSASLVLSMALLLAALAATANDAPPITAEDVAAASAQRQASPELKWQAGCAAEVARDCSAYAAFLVKQSKTPTPQDAEAVDYLERGCRLGDAAGCRLLAAFRKHGRGGAADEGKARAAMERACALGDQRACAH